MNSKTKNQKTYDDNKPKSVWCLFKKDVGKDLKANSLTISSLALSAIVFFTLIFFGIQFNLVAENSLVGTINPFSLVESALSSELPAALGLLLFFTILLTLTTEDCLIDVAISTGKVILGISIPAAIASLLYTVASWTRWVEKDSMTLVAMLANYSIVIFYSLLALFVSIGFKHNQARQSKCLLPIFFISFLVSCLWWFCIFDTGQSEVSTVIVSVVVFFCVLVAVVEQYSPQILAWIEEKVGEKSKGNHSRTESEASRSEVLATLCFSLPLFLALVGTFYLAATYEWDTKELLQYWWG